MTNWATRHERGDPLAISHQVLALVREYPEITNKQLAHRTGVNLHTIESTVRRLQSQGLIRGEKRRIPNGNGAPLTFVWVASDHDAPPICRYDTDARVLEALQHGPSTVKRLSDALQRSENTVAWSVRRLIKQGKAMRTIENGKRLIAIVLPDEDDEDDWQPPTQYMTAARAYALGLKR